jgi:hypothetical protein
MEDGDNPVFGQTPIEKEPGRRSLFFPGTVNDFFEDLLRRLLGNGGYQFENHTGNHVQVPEPCR